MADADLYPTPLLYVPYGFRCSRPEQQNFLYNRAVLDQQEDISRTFLVRRESDERLIGFFTIAMDAIPLNQRERPSSQIPYVRLPAVKLCQLAVHEDLERQGYGKQIVAMAAAMAIELRSSVGCRYLTVDAVPGLADWYSKQEFKVNKLDEKQRKARMTTNQIADDQLPTSMRLDLHSLLKDLRERFPRDFPQE